MAKNNQHVKDDTLRRTIAYVRKQIDRAHAENWWEMDFDVEDIAVILEAAEKMVREREVG